MSSGARSLGLRGAVTASVLAFLLGGGMAMRPAMADDGHDRGHHESRDRGWQDRDRREHARRDREWRDRGRVYYGDRAYVDPPPAVVYGPPPPPPGLNLMFSFGR